jgi:hypothetical protein
MVTQDDIKRLITNSIVGARLKYPKLMSGARQLDAWQNPLEAAPLAEAIILDLAEAGFEIVSKKSG